MECKGLLSIGDPLSDAHTQLLLGSMGKVVPSVTQVAHKRGEQKLMDKRKETIQLLI